MKISVVTVCLYGSSALEETIASVQSQSYGDVEHVIVTAEPLAPFDLASPYAGSLKRVTRWVSLGAHGGQAAGWNLGLREASGDVLGFLRPGSSLHDADVLTQVKAQLNLPGCSVVFGDGVDLFASEVGLTLARYRHSNRVSSYRQVGASGPALDTLYLKRHLLARIGGMKEFLGAAAIPEFTRRVVVDPSSKPVQLRVPLVKRGVPASGIARRTAPAPEKLDGIKNLQPTLSLVNGAPSSVVGKPRSNAVRSG